MTAADALAALYAPSTDAVLALGGLLLVLFVMGIATARAIRSLIVVGNTVGFLFAMVALSISVVSFPLLLDRDVGAAVALATSVRVMRANPLTIALWGLMLAGILVIGSLPLFIGLTVTLPLLGHASWHLYRKAVEPDPSPRPDYAPQPRAGRRYARGFPRRTAGVVHGGSLGRAAARARTPKRLFAGEASRPQGREPTSQDCEICSRCEVLGSASMSAKRAAIAPVAIDGVIVTGRLEWARA